MKAHSSRSVRPRAGIRLSEEKGGCPLGSGALTAAVGYVFRVDEGRCVSSAAEENDRMQPGDRRRQLDAALRSAYSEGLLSENTFLTRLDCVLGDATVDPRRVIGDLTIRASRRPHAGLRRMATRIELWPHRRSVPLLALEWSAPAHERLSIGRSPECHIVLDDDRVSRRHAELLWRSGTWVIRDTGSQNGTSLNGRHVSRAQLRPGDYIAFADQRFRID